MIRATQPTALSGQVMALWGLHLGTPAPLSPPTAQNSGACNIVLFTGGTRQHACMPTSLMWHGVDVCVHACGYMSATGYPWLLCTCTHRHKSLFCTVAASHAGSTWERPGGLHLSPQPPARWAHLPYTPNTLDTKGSAQGHRQFVPRLLEMNSRKAYKNKLVCALYVHSTLLLLVY